MTHFLYLKLQPLAAKAPMIWFSVTQEILDSINTLKVEEWDTNSLQIVEKETVMATDSLPHVYASEDEGSAPHWFQTDSEDARGGGGILPDALSDTPQSSPFTYTSGYTTMEVFNQVMPQCVQANTDVIEAEKSDLTVVKSGLDYIRQFSSSPTTDSELSTFLWEWRDKHKSVYEELCLNSSRNGWT